MQPGAEGPTVLMRYTRPGVYFGEIALLHDQPRHANVVARGACVVAALARSAFDRLLGPLTSLLEGSMAR
eukprot:4427894-Pyramimonas_sp.AAC.1